MVRKKTNSMVKEFTDMAAGTALFGASSSIIGDTAASMTNPAAKSITNAAGIVYAAGYLKKVAKKSDLW